MNRFSPQTKTISATIFFIVAGLIGLMRVTEWDASVPLIIFYAVITLNTYYSVKLFTDIVREHTVLQDLVDVILVCLYVYLAWNFSNPFIFSVTVLSLFIVATTKYILLFGKIPHINLLKRKISIDSAGIAMGIIAVTIMIYGNPTYGSWFLAAVFGVANSILLYIKPMYRI